MKLLVEGKEPSRKITIEGIELSKMALITVSDIGPGLPSGVDQIIFEPYVRLPGTSQPGIGLGLATVKRIVEAYGGTVGVHSVIGRGSSFWFELPVASPEANASR